MTRWNGKLYRIPICFTRTLVLNKMLLFTQVKRGIAVHGACATARLSQVRLVIKLFCLVVYSALVHILPWFIFCLGVYSKYLGLDVYSAFPLSLPVCILSLGVYLRNYTFRFFCLQASLHSNLVPFATYVWEVQGWVTGNIPTISCFCCLLHLAQN